MSMPVVGLVALIISQVPSGETDTESWRLTLSDNRSGVPLPSAACQKRFRTPVRSEAKINRRPSRVQVERPVSAYHRIGSAGRRRYDL